MLEKITSRLAMVSLHIPSRMLKTVSQPGRGERGLRRTVLGTSQGDMRLRTQLQTVFSIIVLLCASTPVLCRESDR
jgi:hypothetical protein